MRHFASEAGAENQCVFCHLTQMLIEHFFRNWRQPPFQFSDPDRAILELSEDWDRPLPVDQGYRKLDGRLFPR
jgi:hypothetical protein